MTLHPHAAGLFAILDPRWRRKVFTGGLLLLLAPPFGWPAILGYRKELVRHLFLGLPEPLPAWEGRRLRYFLEGLRAIGVIFGYFLPLYAALFVLVLRRGWVPGPAAPLAAAFFLLFPIFSTLSFPAACLALAFGTSPGWISPGELALFLALFAADTFLIPAGFLEVSRTGRYRSAFALWRTVPLLLRHLGAYLAAWWYSGLMSLTGHLAIPLSPWGVVWCYLGIIFLFNEILLRAGQAPGEGWMARAVADARLSGGRVFRLRWTEDGAGERVRILDLGLFSAPLPRWGGRRR